MAAMSNYLENKLIDALFRNTSFTPPTTLFIALCTTTPVDSDTGTNLTSGSGGTGVEVTGGSYARAELDPSTTNWANTQNSGSGASSGTNGTTSNTPAITFTTATGSWGTITGCAILDASTNGNMLWFGALSTSKTVNTGDVFQFNANQLSVQIDN
jgi:hypothetical protein